MLSRSACGARLQTRIGAVAISGKYRTILAQFVESYLAAIGEHALPEAESRLNRYLDLVDAQGRTPSAFEPFHRHITAPFDYYAFGLEFLRPVIDMAGSSLSARSELMRIERALQLGENVIFLANHQTEGDPQVISLLLEDEWPDLARDMVFVAGERVTADPLAVPFSLGRNLLCIYSKRYVDVVPAERAERQAHNTRTMDRMRALLSDGGRSIYVAPSGGRDRADQTGAVDVAPFDAKSLEFLYLTARRAGRPCRFCPMALATYDLLPPPGAIQVELGEARDIQRSAVHLAIGPELDMERFPGHDLADKGRRRDARAAFAWAAVRALYLPIAGRRRPQA